MASTCRTLGTKYKRALEKLKLIKRFRSVNSFCDQPSLFQVLTLKWQKSGKENAWKYPNKVGVKYQRAEFRWFRICALAESADGCMKWDTGGGINHIPQPEFRIYISMGSPRRKRHVYSSAYFVQYFAAIFKIRIPFILVWPDYLSRNWWIEALLCLKNRRESKYIFLRILRKFKFLKYLSYRRGNGAVIKCYQNRQYVSKYPPLFFHQETDPNGRAL